MLQCPVGVQRICSSVGAGATDILLTKTPHARVIVAGGGGGASDDGNGGSGKTFKKFEGWRNSQMK